MLGEPKNQFSPTRAAPSTRRAQKQIPISSRLRSAVILSPLLAFATAPIAAGAGRVTTGSQTWNAGYQYYWSITRATWGQGGTLPWDQTVINGTLTIATTTTNSITIFPLSLYTNGHLSVIADFNPYAAYSWNILTATNGIIGFAANRFRVDTSGFTSPAQASVWSISCNGRDLILTHGASVPPLGMGTPEIPRDQEAGPGGSALFQAPGYDYPIWRRQWFKNDAPVPGATNSTFTLDPVQPADAGSSLYVVSYPSSGSRTSRTAQLLVDGAPFIVTGPDPQTQTNCTSATASFNVRAGGTPPIFYQWYFSGTTPLAEATSPTLTLTNLQAANAGTYAVDIVNDLGHVRSTSAVLTVKPAAPGSFTTINRLPSSQGFSLTVSGSSGAFYSLEGSPDCVSWSMVAGMFATNGTCQFLDPAPNPPQRFYRTRLGP
jgi:hypothetical protein